MVGFEELFESRKHIYDKNEAGFSIEKNDPGRCPTGIFPLDYTLGGGIPNGRISVFYGKESSGKTSIALLAIANYQKMYPDRRCIFMDVEGHYDSEWARRLGVNTETLFILDCDYAEMYVDELDQYMEVDDLGLVVLDSLAAFSPKAELEDSVEQSHMGRISQIQSVMIRKIEHALNRLTRRHGYAPPFIILNQARANYNKKTKYSPDDMMPGSRNSAHAGVLVAKIGAYPVKDPTSTVLPVKNKITFTISRAKMKTLNKGITFDLVVEDHGNYKAGDISDELNFITSQLESMGQKTKNTKGGGYTIAKEKYKRIRDFQERLKEDFDFSNGIKQSIIDFKLKESILS